MTDRSLPTRRYPTRVDWWLGALLVAVPVIVVVSAVALTLAGDASGAIVGWLSVAGVVALYVGLVWPVVYELGDDALIIRFGLVRSRVPYRRIRAVRPTRSVLASPALSVDRLAIDIGGRIPTTISPADRDPFLTDLAARVPHLRREGDVLVGRSA
ncbi:MAG TPA: PH domain-containing protein [Patescibacteria group bacterium]|nr:PH domain-containing protein [Patescibacteria group bacterium]